MSTPQLYAEHGVYTAIWHDPEQVMIDLSRMRSEHRTGTLTAEITVYLTGWNSGETRPLHRARLNLLASATRRQFAEHLDKLAPEMRSDWQRMVEIATQFAVDSFRSGEEPMMLRDVEPPPDAGFVLPPLLLGRHPAILFGDGGTGKSYLALAAALSLEMDRCDLLGLTPAVSRRVAYLDWELDGWEHRDRMRRLVGEQMPDLLYVRCVEPLRDEVDRLRRIIRDHGREYLIVDSVGAACGGEPESAEVAIAFFTALRQIGLGSLCLAHTTKAAGADDKPFGSTYWHNYARSTWLVKKQQDEGGAGFTVGLFNKKSNVGPLARPLGYRLSFDGDRTRLESADPRLEPALAGQVSVPERIRGLLDRAALTREEIAAELPDVKPDTVDRTLRRLLGERGSLYELPDGRLGRRTRS